MALSVRELLLIMRVRDEASRTLNNFSRNLRMSGAATEAEMARLAKSQSLHNLGSGLIAAGVGVAAVGAAGVLALGSWANAAIEYNRQAALTLTQVDQTGVSLQQIGKIGLDVAKQVAVPIEEIQSGLYDIFSSMDVTVGQSQMLLTEYSKAAVAGQVSLQDAGRATTGILNAYKLGAEGVNRVNDVMFQLVRKGVGTYGQFATTIGRAVPSAVRAGQSIESLAGMMAFLTRNGLSAAMAAASSARALDALSNPKAVKNMEQLGIKVKDAKGELLPVVDIIQNLHDKLAGLTGPLRAAAIQQIFKGAGGTIQARRFLDVAIKDPTALKKLVAEMGNASGQMEKAYKTMANTPAMQLQLLQNQLKALAIDLGQAVVPILMTAVGWISQVVQWFNNLSPAAKEWIVKIVMVSSVMMILLGVATAIVGVFLLLAAAGMAVGIGFGTVLAIIGGIALAIPILIGIVVLIIAKWDWFKAKAIEIWGAIVDYVLSVWKNIGPPIMKIIKSITDWFYNVWIGLRNWWVAMWPDVLQAASNVWTAITTVIKVAVTIISAFWDRFGGWILSAVQNVWTTISGVISGVLTVIQGIIQFVMGLISGHWENAWNGLKKVLIGILQIILNIALGFASGLLNVMVQALGWVPGLGDKLREAQGAFEGFRTNTLRTLAQWSSDLNATGYNAGANFVNGLSSALQYGTVDTSTLSGIAAASKLNGGVSSVKVAKVTLKKVSKITPLSATDIGNIGKATPKATVKTAAQRAKEAAAAAKKLAADIASAWSASAKAGKALEGVTTADDIVNKFATFLDDVNKVMALKKFPVAKKSGIVNYINSVKNQLLADAAALENINTRLAAAKDALKAIKDEADAFRKDVVSGIMGQSLISGDVPADSGAFNQMLQDRIKAVKDFINNMQSLIGRGLDKTLVQDLLKQGAESGGPWAAFLNGASGSDLAALNDSQKQLTDLANTFGDSMYQQYYANGVSMAQGLVDGLQSQQTALMNQMTALADAMVTRVKALLGIASPSKVFHDIGKWSMMGWSQGIDKNANLVMSSIGGVVGSTVARASSPGTSQGKQVIQHFEITTQEIDPVKHAADLGWEMARRGPG